MWGWLVILGVIVVAVALTDKYKWIVTNVKPTIRNAVVHADLVPHFSGDRCVGFDVQIENKTGEDLEVLWDETLYLQDNKTKEGFYFNQTNLFRQMQKPRKKDVVFPNSLRHFTLFPDALVEEASRRSVRDLDRDIYRTDLKSHFTSRSMREGEHGLFLVVRHEGHSYKEKLSFKLAKEKVE